MSTNEAGWGGLPTGLPDPEVLARMAAEFFGAFPGTGEVAQGPVATLPQPPAPTVPGGSEAFDSSAAPAFSFLREGRPLFGGRETLAEPVSRRPRSLSRPPRRNWRRRREVRPRRHFPAASAPPNPHSRLSPFWRRPGLCFRIHLQLRASPVSGPRTPGPNSRA